jgi:hypothetical protein
MSSASRFQATLKRKREWAVLDYVPTSELADGCDYCFQGWAEGPGLVYRCGCNPGENHYYSTEPEYVKTEGYFKKLFQRIRNVVLQRT